MHAYTHRNTQKNSFFKRIKLLKFYFYSVNPIFRKSMIFFNFSRFNLFL